MHLNSVRTRLDRSATAKRIYHLVRRRNRILGQIDAYIPYSSGSLRQLASLTVEAVNETPALLDAVAIAGHAPRPTQMDTEQFWRHWSAPDGVALKERLDWHGSDKAGRHDYHLVYAAILHDIAPATAMIEIGLGSNNTDVPSNMGPSGSPGASLRAFRDVLPDCRVFGADVDGRILFREDRIETFQVDQTDDAAMGELLARLPRLDLVIDDGLHTPSANLHVLLAALRVVRPGGWIVVEDIRPEIDPLWRAVAGLLPRHDCYLVDTRDASMFCLKVGASPSG